jgi:sporulation-control protein spo0M
MEILDKLKSLVGVGAPTITLTGVPGPLRAGHLLRGSVVLQGGDYDAPVKDVQVRLEEERLVWPSPGRPERQFWRHIAEVAIALDGRVLKQSERLELSFELIVPVDLAATGGSVGYSLVAETEVPGLNPRAEQVVVVEAG